jgi:hypothetical protein
MRPNACMNALELDFSPTNGWTIVCSIATVRLAIAACGDYLDCAVHSLLHPASSGRSLGGNLTGMRTIVSQ